MGNLKEEKLSEQIRKKIQKGKPLDQIADELEEVPETIRPLYEKIKQEMLQENKAVSEEEMSFYRSLAE